MALSEEQKRKIIKEEEKKLEEEKYRESIKKNLKKKPKGKLTGFVLIFIAISILFASFMGSSSDTSTNNVVDKEDLNGSVTFSDLQFNVTNLEDKEWNYCHFTLNSDYHYPGNSFSDKFGPVKAGEIVTIPSGQFAKSDGTRFNPFSVKPQSLNLDCNRRFGYWEWK